MAKATRRHTVSLRGNVQDVESCAPLARGFNPRPRWAKRRQLGTEVMTLLAVTLLVGQSLERQLHEHECEIRSPLGPNRDVAQVAEVKRKAQPQIRSQGTDEILDPVELPVDPQEQFLLPSHSSAPTTQPALLIR